MRFAVIGLSFIALCSGIVFAFDIPSKPSGFVNDYANILKVETKQKLEQELSLFSASTTNEIAIVTVKSLGDRDTIESLGIRIADTWKIGTKGNDNGIIFLISSDDKQARIEVGYGLEGIMPDTIAAQILAEDVFPKFKTGNFDAGIITGTEHIMRIVEGEVFVPKQKSTSFSVKDIESVVVFGVWFLVFLAQFLARSKTWWQGGVIGVLLGIIVGFIFYKGLLVFVFAVVIGLLGLLTDYILSKIGPFGGAGGGYMGPMSWGGFGGGGSSSSFGGFGGGRFGGGGASGNW